jgi:hypothetical protein
LPTASPPHPQPNQSYLKRFDNESEENKINEIGRTKNDPSKLSPATENRLDSLEESKKNGQEIGRLFTHVILKY